MEKYSFSMTKKEIVEFSVREGGKKFLWMLQSLTIPVFWDIQRRTKSFG